MDSRIRFATPTPVTKGLVEAKVRFIRSNIRVPVPSFDDVHAYNKALLPACMAQSNKAHYLSERAGGSGAILEPAAKAAAYDTC